MRTVRGAATGTRVLTEMVLAHELTHALEDQRFGLGLDDQGGSDDARARAAGARRGQRLRADVRLRASATSRRRRRSAACSAARSPTPGSLPGFLQAQLVFPYTGGQAFVAALRERAGGRWTLVDLAERTRPPASTEQVMHPAQVGAPSSRRCRCGRAPAAALGPGWERAAAGVLGRVPDARAARARGRRRVGRGRRGLGRGPLRAVAPRRRRDCAAPCRRDAALVVRWRWDTPADSREFAAKLRQWVRRAGARAADLGIDGGHVAVAERGGAVTLAMAPSGPLARRLAAAGPRGWVGRVGRPAVATVFRPTPPLPTQSR